MDEARNKQDVRAFLASVASRFVDSDVTVAEINASVKNKFKIDLDMSELEEPMRISKLQYEEAMRTVMVEPQYDDLISWGEAIDDELRQPEASFETLYYEDAPAAREAMLAAVAREWEPLKPGSSMQRPRQGTQLPWVETAVDPGLKGEPRSREKMALDYGGEAAQLKDLARITLIFDSCKALLHGLHSMKAVPGWRVVQCKNKWKNPTPMVSGCAAGNLRHFAASRR